MAKDKTPDQKTKDVNQAGETALGLDDGSVTSNKRHAAAGASPMEKNPKRDNRRATSVAAGTEKPEPVPGIPHRNDVKSQVQPMLMHKGSSRKSKPKT